MAREIEGVADRSVVGGHVVCTFPDADGKLTLSYRLNHWKLRWWIFTTMWKFLFAGKLVDSTAPEEAGLVQSGAPTPLAIAVDGDPSSGTTWRMTDDWSWAPSYDETGDYIHWPSHTFTSRRSASMAMHDAAGIVPFEPADVVLKDATLYFRTVALKDQIVPPAFDRSKPLYRLIRDEEDFRKGVFYYVLPDNSPGDQVDEETHLRIMASLRDSSASWVPHFWLAYQQHGKATIYEGSGIT